MRISWPSVSSCRDQHPVRSVSRGVSFAAAYAGQRLPRLLSRFICASTGAVWARGYRRRRSDRLRHYSRAEGRGGRNRRAQAVWGMARNLCPDRERASIALAAVLIVILFAGSLGQIAAIGAGSLAGLWLCRSKGEAITGNVSFPVSHSTGAVALVLFFALIFGLPLIVAATSSQGLAVFGSFYRAGSLVFDGGHVVLPLLEAEVVRPGWVSADQFLAGYGAAQAVPGPLFTFAAYLGTVLGPEPNGLLGAVIALVASSCQASCC